MSPDKEFGSKASLNSIVPQYLKNHFENFQRENLNHTPKVEKQENYMHLYKNQDLLPIDFNVSNLIKKN